MAKSKLSIFLPQPTTDDVRQALALLFRVKDESVYFWIRAKPGATKESLTFKGGQLTLSLRAPPVDGKANVAITKAVAALFKVAKSRVHIVVGEKARDKELRVFGISVEECVAQLCNNAAT